MAGLEGFRKGRRRKGLYTDNLNGATIPRSNSCDQAAAPHSDEQCVDIGGLLIELHTQGALPKHGLVLVEGMDGYRTRLCHPCLARGQRVGIAIPLHDEISTVLTDALHFGGGRNSRNEDLCGHPQFHGRIGDSSSMVSS